VEFRILGTLEVEDQARAVDVRGAKRRALLARLLLSPNQAVPDERLAHDVWLGFPPRGARSTLASHVSLLRKALGPDRIEHRAGGYRLAVHDDELDAAAFESDVAGGRRAMRVGNTQHAADCLEGGLRRWRGAALVDVDGAFWAHGEIARLDELRLGAEEALLETRLSLGQHQAIVAAAEAGVRAEPLREQRWATLMIALYRSGRQAEALRAFQRLRSLLDEQLGVEPSPGLAQLEEAIVLQSPDLNVTTGPVEVGRSPRSQPSRLEVSTVLMANASSGAATSRGSDGGSRPLLALMADEITTHGGHRMAMETDDVRAVFESPTDGLAAAASMQVEWAAHRHMSRGAGGLRIGVSIGEVALVDAAWVGEPVDEAYALSTRARPGQILVTAKVRLMAGSNYRLPFTEAEDARIDHWRAPVPVLSLDWKSTPPGSEQIPLIGVLAESESRFVGRNDELGELQRLAARAEGGQRQVVLVGGEPGIGKTSLVAEIARQVQSGGGTVLLGGCREVANAPFQPFIEALGHYVDHAPTDELRHHVEQFGGELTRLLPGLSRRVPDSPPPTRSDDDTERFLAFRAAVGLLAAASRHQLVLLVLEDVHWADHATQQLLQHLTSSPERMSLLILGTFRSSEMTPEHPLSDTLAALWRAANVSRVELAGLSRLEVADLCRSIAGPAIDEDAVEGFATDLHRETAGNPFFVGELLRHLVESGELVAGGGSGSSSSHPHLRGELPVSLREVIGQRVHHLGAKGELVLSLAAVIGEAFELATLTQVADMSPDALLDLLERAKRSSLLNESGTTGSFEFTHALIRRALYGGLQPARRRQLHSRVAAALEVEKAPSAVLAHHFLAAGDLEIALRYAERAGYESLDAMAPAESARWLTEACGLHERLHPDEPIRHCDLVTQRGISLRLAGDPSYRHVLLEAVAEAKAVGDGPRMAVAALANTRGYYSAAGESDDERLEALRGALDLLGEADGRLRSLLDATICGESIFGTSLGDRRALAGQAVRRARSTGDPRTILEVSNRIIEALRYPTELHDRLEETESVLELAYRLGDPAALFWAIGHRMRALVEAGRIEEAADHFARMTDVSSELAQPFMRWMTLFTTAQWSLLRGESTTGERLAEEAYQLGLEIGQPDAFNYYATQLSHVRWQQGRLAELVELIEVGAEANPGIPGYRGALARAYCQADRGPEAHQLLEEEIEREFSDLPQDLLWTYGMVTYAEAAIQLEHGHAAEILYRQMAPFHDQVSYLGTTCEGPIAHYLGGLALVLGRHEAADEHLRSATRFAKEARSPFFGTRASIETGRLAARRGDPVGARHHLTEGYHAAVRGGFAAEARRADLALGALV
jgi:DNA-binding SARP family transcriptional activator/tetratricopeptide (TPR) repeat protein